MKKQVIENFNEWNFEAEAAASGSPLTPVLKKVEGIFPKAAWYKKMENSGDINVSDPEMVKAFKVVKRFFDPKAPELAANQGKDFFSYYEVKGQNAKDKNGGTGPVAAIHNDLGFTKDLYTALVPTLMTSGFPQTKAFKAAAEMAVRTNPEVSKLLALPTVKPHVETLYTELTKPA